MEERKYDRRLKRLCKKCLKINHECIRREPYIGLCAKNDKEELIELWENK